MIFIVEGVDKVGKTSLIKKLAPRFKALIYKGVTIDFNKNNTERVIGEINCLTQLSKINNIHIFVDRLFLSEYAYSKFFQRGLEEQELILTYEKLKEEIVLIYLDCDTDKLKVRFELEKDIKFEDVIRLQSLFKEAMTKFNANKVIVGDSGTFDQAQLTNQIVKKINKIIGDKK